MGKVGAILQKSKLSIPTLTNSYTVSSTSLSYKNLLSNHIKNQRLDQANKLFNKIPSPDPHLYTIMINGFAQNNRLSDALQLFDKMSTRDTVSWNSMIQGCLNCGELNMGLKLFQQMPERTVVSWTTMVNGLLRASRVEEAERLFREMLVRDVAAWNAMIFGYFNNGMVESAIKLFKEMPCRNVISWTSVINGLDQCGRSEEALSVFQVMVKTGIKPNSSTFSSVLTVCANALTLRLGIQIHCVLVKLGYYFDEFITASLISLYANCKHMADAFKIFEEKLHLNVVVWTALLTGYGTNSMYDDSFKLFRNMVKVGIIPNQSTLTSVLNSCCGHESLDKGREIHAVSFKLGLETDAFVGNSLIVMYSQCGNISDSFAVFEKIGEKNIVSWNSIIVGCAQHGCGVWSLALFSQMIRKKIDPDEITFTGLLSSCSHSGMLNKGRRFFDYMSRLVEVKLQHYACMVDILGRNGKLEEAEELIEKMPLKANTEVWLALLSACKMHSNLEIAEKAANRIFNLDPQCSAAYVLLSNLYATGGKWSDVSRMRLEMKQRGIVKQPGHSW
ncbi:hypothetical protein ACFE04_013713 [Oxalis oulophora]